MSTDATYGHRVDGTGRVDLRILFGFFFLGRQGVVSAKHADDEARDGENKDQELPQWRAQRATNGEIDLGKETCT